MKGLPLDYAVLNLGRRPLRTLLTCAAAALIGAALLGATAFVRSLESGFERTGSGDVAIVMARSSDGDVIRATQTELGKLAGMSRAAFRRAFSELLASGIVKTEYGKVRITDRAALKAEAAQR